MLSSYSSFRKYDSFSPFTNFPDSFRVASLESAAPRLDRSSLSFLLFVVDFFSITVFLAAPEISQAVSSGLSVRIDEIW